MLEKNGKKYYTIPEIVDMIYDPNTEISAAWKRRHPNYLSVVLLEQVSRILYTARKNKKVSVIEFTKTENGKRKYLTFLLEDVIDLINTRRFYNLKLINKE